MVSVGLSSGFYRYPPLQHRLGSSVANLLLLLWWLELFRVGAFFWSHREQFHSLKLATIAEETVSIFPDDFELTVYRRQADSFPLIRVNRDLPYRVELPPWCSTVMSLLLGHMSRSSLSAEEAAELLPEPVILFTSEDRMARMRGHELDFVHLVLSEARMYIYGIPYLRHHLLEALGAAVCERREAQTGRAEWVCTKAHAKRVLALLRAPREEAPPRLSPLVEALKLAGALLLTSPAPAPHLACTSPAPRLHLQTG